jgi:protease-4
MKDFLKNLLASVLGTFIAGALACFLVLILIIALITTASNHETPGVFLKSKTFLVIGNGMLINDTPQHGNPSLSVLLESQKAPEVDLLRAIEAIKHATKDKNISGILITGETDAGLVQLNELRQAISDFKKSKKPVVAWIENGSQHDYYLASVADTIYAHPAGEVEFKGLAGYSPYIGETLKSLGVGVQVTKVGKYKSAVEPFLSDKMSDADREQTELLLSGAWKKIIADVGASRKLSSLTLNRIVNSGGIFTTEVAKKFKLVDELCQRDELVVKIRSLGAAADDNEQSFRQISLTKYANKVGFPSGDGKIAVVYAEGEIVDGWGDNRSVGGDRLAKDLRDLRGDKTIKAVVLRINSPGGSAFASDIVAHEVGLLKKIGIPVVVSMGDVAASGGYYIAARGNRIIANPATITGSIGVFGLHFNYQELAKKINLGTDGVKTSRYADLFSSHRAATAEELAIVQTMVDQVYQDFLNVVSEGRKLEVNQVHEIAQGRVWLGVNAKEVGLVDKMGGLMDAINLAKDLAKKPDASIVQVPSLHSGRENILQKILSEDENENPVFVKSKLNDPALQILKSHVKFLNRVGNLNDPKGVYLRCPVELSPR